MYKKFRYWCYKVLPLVYDDSLSYYELLCKVIDYLNHMIDDHKMLTDEIAELRKEIDDILLKIEQLKTTDIEKMVEKFLATMIFVEISNAGYFIYYIPESWEDITFNTTDLDIEIDGYDYGHLVLSY